MSYLTSTSDITTTLQNANCRMNRKGSAYMDNLEKGKMCSDDLDDVDLGLDLIDAIVGYKAPSDEVLATGTITIVSGSGGTVQAFVNGVAISSTVAWTGAINTTATNLAASITSTALYSASANSNIVTVTALTGTGANPNRLPLTAVAASMSVTSTDFTGGVTAAADKDYVAIVYEDLSGEFEVAETVVGGTSEAEGEIVTSTTSNLSLTNLVGVFENGETITGETSGASATIIVLSKGNCISLASVNNILNRLRKIRV